MRLIAWLFGALVAFVLILFAVSNRESVVLKFEPLPFVIELPLYAALLATLLAGFVAGGLVSWLSGRKWRLRARRAEREAEQFRREHAADSVRLFARPASAPPPPTQPPRVGS